MLNRLTPVYTTESFAAAVWDVIAGKDIISLRMLDWVCTNYAKSRALRLHSNGRTTYVFEEYLSQLRYYRRRYFDPFRRSSAQKTPNECTITRRSNGDAQVTTLAQLNFMCWVHDIGLLAFVRKHRSEIEEDMNRVATVAKRRRLSSDKCRNALSSRPTGRCQVYRVASA